jgi:hypothetical protein
MPLAAGFVGIIPALNLLDEEKDGSRPVTLTWISAVGWSCAIAYFGYVCFKSSMHRTIELTIVQRLHVPPYQKESGTWDLKTFRAGGRPRNRQIVEEELTFPSGTATAKVISVLHGMPSTSSGLRPRHGYSPLVEEEQDEETSSSPDIAGDSEDPGSQTNELVRNHAWFTLLWSFLASSVLTVFTSNSSSYTEVQTFI